MRGRWKTRLLTNELTVVVEEESRDGRDAELAHAVRELLVVDVELREAYGTAVLGERSLEQRRKFPARGAPVRVAVEDEGVPATLGDELVEVLDVRDVDDRGGGSGGEGASAVEGWQRGAGRVEGQGGRGGGRLRGVMRGAKGDETWNVSPEKYRRFETG